MELREIVRILWKRLWIIALGTILISVIVFVASRNMTPVYQAKVTLMVNQSTNTPFAGYLSLSTGEGLALTYSELLKARPLLEIVIANLDLNLSPDGLREMRENRIRTSLVPDTQLLELTVEDASPQRASDIANEIALMFVSLRNTEQQLQDIVALEEDIVAQISNVKEAIARNESRVSSALTDEQAELARTTLSGQQQAYAQLLATYLDVRLTQAQLLDVSVVEPAIPPTTPIRPDITLYTFLGAWIGLVFSGGIAFLVEYLDRSFDTREDVSQVLPLPTLGTIPRDPAHASQQDNGLVALDVPTSPVSEAYRTLRTNIRFASIDRSLRALLVTSADPGAGKTTVVANLGIVCAQAGLRVVVMDADLRRPMLHQRFDLRNHSGLTDLLVNDIQSIEKALVDTEIDNLRLIASGPIPPNPSELLGSESMQTVLAEAERYADLVIIDTPPALAVTDAAVLASKVDGVILLIEAGRTSHKAARHAWETLRRVGTTVLGVVLTKARLEGKAYYHYYYAKERQRRPDGVWQRLSEGLSRRMPRLRPDSEA
jgi:non-specific protein-tyrosine kinase